MSSKKILAWFKRKYNWCKSNPKKVAVWSRAIGLIVLFTCWIWEHKVIQGMQLQNEKLNYEETFLIHNNKATQTDVQTVKFLNLYTIINGPVIKDSNINHVILHSVADCNMSSLMQLRETADLYKECNLKYTMEDYVADTQRYHDLSNTSYRLSNSFDVPDLFGIMGTCLQEINTIGTDRMHYFLTYQEKLNATIDNYLGYFFWAYVFGSVSIAFSFVIENWKNLF
ncbi:MAG: hypothetical protein JST87_00350 [Bacteroidetes bacterium]|nr:hypothetical protein [Bacteroidota bacterium]